MDRSYLSDQQVVTASRGFVCARLITFEDSQEAALMKRLLGSRKLVNTVFTILDPSGKQALTRAGRSPRMAFRDGEAMAALQECLADEPEDATLNRSYIAAARRAGKLDEAHAFYLDLLRHNPEAKKVFGYLRRVARAADPDQG